ncbi:hypothetical protein FB451DRAFT_1372023, partial [Mycena latifolia]
MSEPQRRSYNPRQYSYTYKELIVSNQCRYGQQGESGNDSKARAKAEEMARESGAMGNSVGWGHGIDSELKARNRARHQNGSMKSRRTVNIARLLLDASVSARDEHKIVRRLGCGGKISGCSGTRRGGYDTGLRRRTARGTTVASRRGSGSRRYAAAAAGTVLTADTITGYKSWLGTRRGRWCRREDAMRRRRGWLGCRLQVLGDTLRRNPMRNQGGTLWDAGTGSASKGHVTAASGATSRTTRGKDEWAARGIGGGVGLRISTNNWDCTSGYKCAWICGGCDATRRSCDAGAGGTKRDKLRLESGEATLRRKRRHGAWSSRGEGVRGELNNVRAKVRTCDTMRNVHARRENNFSFGIALANAGANVCGDERATGDEVRGVAAVRRRRVEARREGLRVELAAMGDSAGAGAGTGADAAGSWEGSAGEGEELTGDEGEIDGVAEVVERIRIIWIYVGELNTKPLVQSDQMIKTKYCAGELLVGRGGVRELRDELQSSWSSILRTRVLSCVEFLLGVVGDAGARKEELEVSKISPPIRRRSRGFCESKTGAVGSLRAESAVMTPR